MPARLDAIPQSPQPDTSTARRCLAASAAAAEVVEPVRAWIILAAATIGMGLGFGVTSSVSVFMLPLEQSFGWSRAEISFSYTLMSIGMAAGGLLWGRLADTAYLRAVVTGGALVLGAGLILASQIETTLELHAISFVLGAAGFACLFTPLATVVGLWFERRRGLAIGILTAGGALGQGLVPLVMERAIAGLGWRDAYLWSGIAYLTILVPLMAMVAKPPAQMMPGTRPAVRSPTGWSLPPRLSTGWLSAAGFFCCFCMAVPLVHVVSVVCHQGHSPSVGAAVLFTIMAVGALGRVGFGVLADRIGALPAYMLASALQTASVFWFVSTPDMAILIWVAALFGFGFAGNMTTLILSVREALPPGLVGRATGVVTAIAWLGMGAGGYVSGWLYEFTGSYAVPFALAAAAGAANLLILATLARLKAGAQVGHGAGSPGVRRPFVVVAPQARPPA